MEVIKYKTNTGFTDCPHGMRKDVHVGSTPVRVGTDLCEMCDHFHTIEFSLKEVVCKYKDNIQKELKDRKIIISDVIMEFRKIKSNMARMEEIIENMPDRIDKIEQDLLVLRDGE